MSSNPFALLDMDEEPKKVTKPVPQKKAAADKKPAQPKTQDAAPKKAFVPKGDKAQQQQQKEKAPLASGQRDRHTKGGRSEGEHTKRPFDRSLNRQTKGQTERKGQDRQVKGGWASKDPQADQVPADVDQKKDEAAKVEEEKAAAEEVKVEDKPVVPEEPQPFLLKDALKSKQKVAGERTKIRAAEGVPGAEVLKAGVKPSSEVLSVKKGQSKINANKKTFNVDEFLVVSGGKANTGFQQEEQQRRRRPNRADFPSL